MGEIRGGGSTYKASIILRRKGNVSTEICEKQHKGGITGKMIEKNVN